MDERRKQDQGWGTNGDAVRKSPAWLPTTLDPILWEMRGPQQSLEKVTSLVTFGRAQTDSGKEHVFSQIVFY